MKDIFTGMSEGEMIEYLARENENLAHLIASANSTFDVVDGVILALADRLTFPHPLTDPETR